MSLLPTAFFSSRRRQIMFLAGLPLILVLGLFLRESGVFPYWFADPAGDILWATAAYWFFGIIFPKASIKKLAIITGIFCLGIEVSELYKAPWIQSIRHTTLGGLVLGFDFYWWDLVRYMAGIGIAILADLSLMPGRATGK